jgi:nitroreductase
MTFSGAADLIKKRKSVYPEQFLPGEITKEDIIYLMELADRAPTHRLTQPWRFKIFIGDSKSKLSLALRDIYAKKTPAASFSESKSKKLSSRPLLSAAVIAVCLHPDPQKSVPEWEEIAALSMAVQNIWLGALDLHIGMYWSSPSLCKTQEMSEFLQLQENEACFGFLYLGKYDFPETLPSPRKPLEEKITFL